MTFRSALRPLAPVAALAVLGATAAGCGNSSSSNSSKNASANSSSAASKPGFGKISCGSLKPGAQSSAVKIGGTPMKPTAKFKKPLKATSLQRSVISRGKGATPKPGTTVEEQVTMFLGTTGKSVGSHLVQVPAAGSAQLPKLFTAGASCLPVGSQAVAVDTAKDVYGAHMPSPKVKPGDTLVLVSRIVGVKKPLKPSAWKGAPPKVTFHGNKPPKLTLPSSKPAKKLEVKVLSQGSGPVVKDGDKVTVNYQGTSWNNGKIFDQSYGKKPVAFATNQVVPGFGAALIGQKVGTKLVVSIPPKDAYGTAKSAQNPMGGQTLVFVIDIKKTQPAS